MTPSAVLDFHRQGETQLAQEDVQPRGSMQGATRSIRTPPPPCPARPGRAVKLSGSGESNNG
jgi:hypothetical protein